ncbi:MAG TPA: DNA adenine methylase [Chloroflexota bacterium]|nr:DNA adenine methylase [Chloroflexota bacterium]
MRSPTKGSVETDELQPTSPFLKWAGGKGQLLNQLQDHLPGRNRYHRYFEPFLGGGAVFFHLQPQRAVLSDLNPELINVYQVIKTSADELMRQLDDQPGTEEHYYLLRSMDLERASPVQRAARFIYLNKWCYNGLYRVNSKGQFNVPRGKFASPPRLYDEANLKNVAVLLRSADIRVGDYEFILREASYGDFVYLDPPYYVLSETANFTRYTADSFNNENQRELVEVLRTLNGKGVRFLLNNHNTDHTKRLYSDYNVYPIITNRMINSKVSGRKGARELIVTNYTSGNGLGRDLWKRAPDRGNTSVISIAAY